MKSTVIEYVLVSVVLIGIVLYAGNKVTEQIVTQIDALVTSLKGAK